MQESNHYQEDEIDLRELFLTLKNNKKIIFGVTIMITLLALLYVFIKTPMYEGDALVKIGDYKLLNNNNNNNNNNKVLLDNPSQLSKELNVIFVDMYKNIKNKKAYISSISVPKKQNSFIEIKAMGVSNNLVKKEIQKVVHYVQVKHQKILDDVSERRKFEIENIDRKITNIKTKETKVLDEKIAIEEQSLKDYKKQLVSADKIIKKIETTNPVLAALTLIEKRDLSNFILKLNIQLLDFKQKRENLDTNTIWKLEEKKNLLKSMLLPHNYKNSHVVGEILTNDYPTKPKKKLIVIVAFVTGLILSIFLVFFLEFIKSVKEE